MNLRYKIGKRIMGKAAPEDFDKAPGYGAFLSLFGGKKNAGEIPWDDYSAQRKEYKGTTFACIRKIASAVAAAGLHLYVPEGNSIRESKRMPIADETKAFLKSLAFCKMTMTISESVEEVTDHAALDIFARANGAMSRHQLFDKTMVDMILNGNCYWRPIMNKTDAFPAAITFLSPVRTKPISKDGVVTGYAYKQSRTNTIKYKLDEVVHFWYPNPHNDFEGFSPVSAASQRISAEVNTATFQNSTLQNMGVPAAMVKILRQMPPERFKEFKKEFKDLYKGVANAGGVGFTQGEWEIEKLGQTLQEMGYIEGSKMLREFIANDLQVPLSKLTMESSNRAVAEAGNTEFLRDTVLPNLVLIAEELTESLIPMFPMLKDAGAFYMFDNPVPEDMRTKMLMRRINRTTGTTTPNEEREEDGREPHPSPEADSLAMIRSPMPEQGETEATRALDIAMGKLKGELGI
jgi:HK97 family phage portal protein